MPLNVETLKEQYRVLRMTNDLKDFVVFDFVDIEEAQLEDSNDFLTDTDWAKMLASKDCRLLFSQNVFAIKNTLLKRGSPSA